MTKEGQATARHNVEAEMARRGWNVSDLAAAADGIDVGTAGDFLNGSRWPQRATQAKIEAAFEWPAGIIRRWERELDPGTLPESAAPPAPADPSGDVLAALLPPEAIDGLSAAHRAEVQARMVWTALAAIREIRRDGES